MDAIEAGSADLQSSVGTRIPKEEIEHGMGCNCRPLTVHWTWYFSPQPSIWRWSRGMSLQPRSSQEYNLPDNLNSNCCPLRSLGRKLHTETAITGAPVWIEGARHIYMHQSEPILAILVRFSCDSRDSADFPLLTTFIVVDWSVCWSKWVSPSHSRKQGSHQARLWLSGYHQAILSDKLVCLQS